MRSRFIERLCELLFSWRASQKNATIQADRHKTYRIEPTFWFWNDLHLLPKIVLLSKSYVRRSKESLFLLLTSCFEHLTACASPAPRSAAERRQVQARVGRLFNNPISLFFWTLDKI